MVFIVVGILKDTNNAATWYVFPQPSICPPRNYRAILTFYKVRSRWPLEQLEVATAPQYR